MARERVLVLGLDGLDPGVLEGMWSEGELPRLRSLRGGGGYARLATTLPAQTPVAWSTFATGLNPGGHGIFDFVTRDPETYRPAQALARHERRSAFLPPRAVNRRRGTPLWSTLSGAGVPSAVIRCPCTYPPEEVQGRVLAGMGVPDLRGSFGTSTYYTVEEDAVEKESERLVRLPGPVSGELRAPLYGPVDPKRGEDVAAELRLAPAGDGLRIRSEGEPEELVLRPGEWSPWLRLSFRLGLLRSVDGRVRFHLAAPPPDLRLYASPVNFDPRDPPYRISWPPEYAAELERDIGPYHTAGMVEDHTGLSNDRLSEGAYLRQCGDAFREREAMLSREMERFHEGLLFCLFDTPDRIQHMFWRYLEPDHPANRDRERPADGATVIRDHYRECDALVGRVLDRTDPETLVVVLSDHGFGSFRRGVHLNRWLHERGYLAFRDGEAPGRRGEGFPGRVDWDRTAAFALGLGGIFLNLRGREAAGTVDPAEAADLRRRIARELAGLRDPETGRRAVRGAAPRERVYRGAFVEEAPDVVPRFAPGYRASWATTLGGAPDGLVEDNDRRWAGDHIVDPASVPGVLLMSRPFRDEAPRMADLAPTILTALGVEPPAPMEGSSLLR